MSCAWEGNTHLRDAAAEKHLESRRGHELKGETKPANQGDRTYSGSQVSSYDEEGRERFQPSQNNCCLGRSPRRRQGALTLSPSAGIGFVVRIIELDDPVVVRWRRTYEAACRMVTPLAVPTCSSKVSWDTTTLWKGCQSTGSTLGAATIHKHTGPLDEDGVDVRRPVRSKLIWSYETNNEQNIRPWHCQNRSLEIIVAPWCQLLTRHTQHRNGAVSSQRAHRNTSDRNESPSYVSACFLSLAGHSGMVCMCHLLHFEKLLISVRTMLCQHLQSCTESVDEEEEE